MPACTNNNMPLVSVIIPAFNASTSIECTIQSVLAQTYPYYEILVIDDGSSDGTSDVVKKLAAGDERIRLMEQVNQGVAAARNYGIRHANGDYIAPLDADDIWFPKKLEKQVAVMQESQSTVGLIYTWSVPVHVDGRLHNFSPGWEEEGAVFLPLLLGNFLSNASTPLICRECFNHVGMYNTNFLKFDAQGCEDWDLYLRIAEHYEFRVVPEHLTGYLQSTESMSADWKRMARSYYLMMEWVRKQHPEIPAFVFRWSKSNYFLYLANKAARAEQTSDSFLLLSKTSVLDPFMLTNRRLQKLLVKNLLKLVSGSGTQSPLGSTKKIEAQEHRMVIKKPAVGIAWKKRLNLRTNKLRLIQNDLKLDIMTNIETAKPGERLQV